jgi:hypothetical protein
MEQTNSRPVYIGIETKQLPEGTLIAKQKDIPVSLHHRWTGNQNRRRSHP